MPPALCSICHELGPGDLSELDLLMGDASRWPATVWGVFSKPKGPLNANRQRFGAVQMAKGWLAARGLYFSDKIIRSHYRYDVVVIASSVEDLVNRGIIEANAGEGTGKLIPSGEKLDPTAFLKYFDRGIKLGNRGLELLEERVDKMIANGEDVPLIVLKMLVENGGKLATTQAMLMARNVKLGADPDEEEGFRAGSQPLPSQRIGHARIRNIEGEDRPVTDTGPADREKFSERSRQEGGEGLPH